MCVHQKQWKSKFHIFRTSIEINKKNAAINKTNSTMMFISKNCPLALVFTQGLIL